MAAAGDLKSPVLETCGFESHYPHYPLEKEDNPNEMENGTLLSTLKGGLRNE